MNVLNPTTASQPSFSASEAALRGPASLIPRGSVFTVVGQVHDWRLGFAGRIDCTLRLSIGDLALSANRDTLPLDLGDGDWVRAKVMHRHDGSDAMSLIRARPNAPAPGQTSWVPVALYHRHAAMAELRRLLSALEPGLQAVFLSVMLDTRVQRQFFWRPTAADHHCYPGGLFDQAVAAAKLASLAEYPDARDRGLATLASLLFDIGKATDTRLQPDRTRPWPELQPHVATASRLSGSLQRLAASQPELAADLCDLLAGDDPTRTARFTPRMTALRQQVREAVRLSWGPAHSFLSIARPGAAA